MASHESTPESVLSAPSVTYEVLYAHNDTSNRESRRHPIRYGREHALEKKTTIPKDARWPAINVPYVKPKENEDRV